MDIPIPGLAEIGGLRDEAEIEVFFEASRLKDSSPEREKSIGMTKRCSIERRRAVDPGISELDNVTGGRSRGEIPLEPMSARCILGGTNEVSLVVLATRETVGGPSTESGSGPDEVVRY